MNRFSSALVRAVAGVHKAFDSDAQFADWLLDLNAEQSTNVDTEPRLFQLLKNLETGWVSSMLFNEERQEESGILAEAVLTEVRSSAGQDVTRSVFAYRLASRIVNKSIRPLNHWASRVEAHPAIETVVDHSTIPHAAVSTHDSARYDRAVEALLSRETRSNEVATAKVTMAVKRVWGEALQSVDQELGGAKAMPMSSAVKEKISERLGLPVSTVEAAMKRYKRAITRLRMREIKAKRKAAPM